MSSTRRHCASQTEVTPSHSSRRKRALCKKPRCPAAGIPASSGPADQSALHSRDAPAPLPSLWTWRAGLLPCHSRRRPGGIFTDTERFSRNGRLLYATENDYANRKGVVGVRDASAGYRPIGEFSSGGIGPHDIAMLPDGRTLVVANGGVATHPDFGRESLNLSIMTPSLAYIDVETGDLLERQELPSDMHRLSIRHLAVVENGSVVFGCQHKGARNVRPGLVGIPQTRRRPETGRGAQDRE